MNDNNTSSEASQVDSVYYSLNDKGAYEKVSLAFLTQHNELKANEMRLANTQLAVDLTEKHDQATDLIFANKELACQIAEKADRAAELLLANIEKDFQNSEKAKRAAELIIANKELAYQIAEKADRASELILANKELAKQIIEKANRAAELLLINNELAYQLSEKALREAELVLANKKLAQQNEKILFMSYHDTMTGLNNRRYYEETLFKLDKVASLPISIVMGDVNGLKLINDSFGHQIGDEIVKRVAKVIKKAVRPNDILARLGGGDFVMILPNTTNEEADKIISSIKSMLAKEKVGTVNVSVSFGCETKVNKKENIQKILSDTEDFLFRNKLHESSSMRTQTINMIMNTLFEKDDRERLRSQSVSNLCEAIALNMDLERNIVDQVKIAGLMHNIGKIGISEDILNNSSQLTPDEWLEFKKHPEIAYRILSAVDEFSEIATYVLQYQETWDGKGYPKGLKGEEISLQARIIAVADTYDTLTSNRLYRKEFSENEAVEDIKRCSGKQFDPKVTRVFVEKVLGKKWE